VRGATRPSARPARRVRLGWRGTPDVDPSLWTGVLVVRGRGQRLRGVLTLGRDASGGTRCGDAFFASDVMPRVLEPICAQCHVEGGLAASAPFRVTVGDPVATSLSALREVNTGDPHSRRSAEARRSAARRPASARQRR
jgi:hypothetical protein